MIFLALVAVGVDRASADGQSAPPAPVSCNAHSGETISALVAKPAKIQDRRLVGPVGFDVPLAGCRIPIDIADQWALPVKGASFGWRLIVQPTDNSTVLTIELRDSAGTFLRSSDVPAADQQLMIPVDQTFKGWVEIKRFDARGAETTNLRVTLSGEALDGIAPGNAKGLRAHDSDAVFLGSLASSGAAFRTDLSKEDYDRLGRIAVAYRERTASNANDKRRVYKLVSELLGRRIEPGRIEFATRSEPIMAFVGISGLSRFVLMDCQAWPMPSKKSAVGDADCDRLSEPWQTSLERAAHFWVAYVEDEQGTYDTSMDLDFDAPEARDYDDFDGQNALRVLENAVAQAGPGASGSKETRRVRVGFRRFALPSRVDSVKVTIVRQGSAYGLKTWSRSFARYGPFPVRLAGTLGVPGWFPATRTISLSNVYAPNSSDVIAAEVSEAIHHQPLFAMASVRYPQLRAAAEQSNRSWRSFFPDAGVGIALPWINKENADEPPAAQSEANWWDALKRQTWVFAAAWQLEYGSRVHFFLGAVRQREIDRLMPVGQRVPTGTPLDQVRTIRPHWHPTIGISVDLARSP